MLSFWLQIHVICSELKSARFNPFTRCILFSVTHAHKNVRCASCYFKLQLESLSALFKSLTFSSKTKVVKSVRICLLVCVSQCAQVVLCRTSLKPKAIREARWWAGLTVNNCALIEEACNKNEWDKEPGWHTDIWRHQSTKQTLRTRCHNCH